LRLAAEKDIGGNNGPRRRVKNEKSEDTNGTDSDSGADSDSAGDGTGDSDIMEYLNWEMEWLFIQVIREILCFTVAEEKERQTVPLSAHKLTTQ
jgi:hypothetical protein